MGAQKSQLDQLRIEREEIEESPSRWWLWLLLLLLLGGGAYFAIHHFRAEVAEVQIHEVKANSPGGTGANTSRTVLNGSGYVTARRQSTVSSKVTGKIVEVLIEEGMKVEQGQVLARLDVSNVKASLRLAEAQVGAAHAQRGETEALLVEAQADLKRLQSLEGSGISSRAELDTALARVDSLKARLEAQEEEVKVAQQQVAVWKQELEDREVRAPFPGIVVAKNAQPGEMISPISAGGFTRTGIGTIVDMSSLEIEVDVNQSYINRVQAGQKVTATLDAYPDWEIPASVIAIIPTADRQKATVKVRIGFDQLDPRILPDMGVKVAFRDAEEKQKAAATSIVVPNAVVHHDGDQDIVWVVSNNRLERRAVRLGSKQNDEIRVEAGIESGDRLVLSGPPNMKEGMRVKEKKS